MKLSTSGLVLIMSLIPYTALSQDSAVKFGFVQAHIDVSASTLVSKDFASMQMSIAVNCQQSAVALKTQITDVVNAVKREVETQSEFKLKSSTPDVQVVSEQQYVVRYNENDYDRLNPFYVDICNNDSPVRLSPGAVDLTQKTFSGYANLSIETAVQLSKLTQLRQKLEIFADNFNQQNDHSQLNIGQENIVVSAQKREKEINNLNERSQLAKVTSRLNVDEKVSGGFDELYIDGASTEVDSRARHQNFAPQLTENGKSRVEVPYTFTIDYLPKNLVQRSGTVAPVARPDLGSLQATFVGEATVDTDYYIATLSVSTQCHDSKEAALAAVTAPFAHFKTLAQSAIVAEVGNPYERVEEKVGAVSTQYPWIDFEKHKVANNPGRGGNSEKVVTKSWLNICTTALVTTKPAEEDLAYSNSSTLTVVTRNFSGIQALRQAALDFTQNQRQASGATRVEVQLGEVVPKLRDEKHFEVVEILAYKSALSQLINPQGTVAQSLLDEVQAGEAYYRVEMGQFMPRAGVARRSAPMPDAAAEGAMPPSEDQYKVIVTSDGNIPMTELRVNKRYRVTYKPKQDLIKVLTKQREASATSAILR